MNPAPTIRSSRPASVTEFNFGPFRLDTRLRRLTCIGNPVELTRSEYLLLRALCQHRGEIVSRRQLMQAVWGITVVSHGTLDALIDRTREKLDEAEPGLIANAKGQGYSLIKTPDDDTGKIITAESETPHNTAR
jgi:DNA-binding response OmpR family regulator